MIYKFTNEQDMSLEVTRSNDMGSKVILTIQGDGQQEFSLDSDSLYQLIGALHSLQTLIKKGGN